MRRKKILLPLLLAAAAVLALGGSFLLRPPAGSLDEFTAQIMPAPSDAGHDKSFRVELVGREEGFRRAKLFVDVYSMNGDALGRGLTPRMQQLLELRVSQALQKSEVYDAEGCFLPELTAEAYARAANERLENPEPYMEKERIELPLIYRGGAWRFDCDSPYIADDSDNPRLAGAVSIDEAMSGYDAACMGLEPIPFHYRLPDWTSKPPKPDAAKFGETEDAAVIEALLQSEAAQKLIGEETMDWSTDKELIPGTKIRYYLDDSILAIVWQQEEHGAVGTFAEVIIGDGSQLRRKLAEDRFGAMSYYYATELAQQVNPVVAVSGDFYDQSARTYGVFAYDGQLMHANPTMVHSCYFTEAGDMLFSFEDELSDQREAQKFLDDNRVMFSLSFGPVLIKDGVNVTPYDYIMGEVRDTYARCAIGQLGRLHYLAMTINCQNPEYGALATLEQAAESMLRHGCKQAYTLDGGQTASIIMNTQLINPVQFGVERKVSDIFYFATAVGD